MEPTAAADFLERAMAASQSGARPIVLRTHGGRVATAGFAAALAEAGVSGLDLVAHGPTEACHDHETRAPGSFRALVTAARRAKAAGMPFVMTAIATRSSFRHLPETVRLAHALGARAFRVEVSNETPDGRAHVPSEFVAASSARAAHAAATLRLPFYSHGPDDHARDWFVDRGTDIRVADAAQSGWVERETKAVLRVSAFGSGAAAAR